MDIIHLLYESLDKRIQNETVMMNLATSHSEHEYHKGRRQAFETVRLELSRLVIDDIKEGATDDCLHL